ncbi:MarR family EPS-associated transcriptional regulator [Gammaproteobacteria bacterium]|jgi:MarR family transcriptional regulator, temperature-dependent positive regulator of motility|nr:MarR family EPS-associated transcriptional regulator [Gammaproteobacteria bacterium]
MTNTSTKLVKIHDELDLKVMIEVEQNSQVNQRTMAVKFEISLGKLNHCIRSLVDVGYVKLENFSGSKNKVGYMYLLTPKGIAAKTLLTKKFLKIKLAEYNKLKEHLK